MIENNYYEEFNKEALYNNLKGTFESLTTEEKSACFVASSFLRECIMILIEKDILQTEEGTDIVHFLFPLDIKDTTLLQEFFIFSVNEKWVIGTFHCPYTQKRDWVNIIKQMLLSIHLEE